MTMRVIYDHPENAVPSVVYEIVAVEESPLWDLQYSSLKEIPEKQQFDFLMSLPEYDRPSKEAIQAFEPLTLKDMDHLFIALKGQDNEVHTITLKTLFSWPTLRREGWERLRDLKDLKRFPRPGLQSKSITKITEETIQYKALIGLNTGIDSDRELFQEMQEDCRYEVYGSLDAFQGDLKAKIKGTKQSVASLTKDFEVHGSFPDPGLIKTRALWSIFPRQFISNVLTAAPIPQKNFFSAEPNVFVAERVGNFSRIGTELDPNRIDINDYVPVKQPDGTYSLISPLNRLFIQEAPFTEGESSEDSFREHILSMRDDISLCRLNRISYFELDQTDPNDKPFYDADSVYTRKVYDFEKIGISKTIGRDCRLQRFLKFKRLIWDAWTWCKKGEYPSFQIKVVPAGLSGDFYRIEKRDISKLAEVYRFHFEANDKVSVYSGRFGSKQSVSEQAEADMSGINILYDNRRMIKALPTEIAQRVFSSIFRVVGSTYGAWRAKAGKFVVEGKRLLKEKKDKTSYEQGLNRLILASLMGTCLTAEQQHEIRSMVRIMCDRFEAAYPKGVIERFEVPINRKNNLEEMGRQLREKMAYKFFQLEMAQRVGKVEGIQQNISHLNQEIERLSRQALSQNLAQQDEETDLEKNQTVERLSQDRQELMALQLKNRIIQLEDQIQALIDPVHPDFNCDLSSLQELRRKEDFAKTWKSLLNDFINLDLKEGTEEIGWELSRLQEQYELVDTSQCSFIADLPKRTQVILGFEDFDQAA